MHINPFELQQRDRYKIAIGAVLPRPIAWVSTIDAAGRLNLAPYSFFTAAATNPLTLLFCPQIIKEGSEKDTLANIRAVPEFVVNIVGEATVEAMSKSAALLPHGESEFAYAGVTPAQSTTIRVPRVVEAPIAFECRLAEIVTVGTGIGSGAVVLGTVQSIYLRDDVYSDGYVQHAQYDPIGRLAGNSYVRITDVFDLLRG